MFHFPYFLDSGTTEGVGSKCDNVFSNSARLSPLDRAKPKASNCDSDAVACGENMFHYSESSYLTKIYKNIVGHLPYSFFFLLRRGKIVINKQYQ